jgi:putative membrane-bound dehydrogenase-like protein
LLAGCQPQGDGGQTATLDKAAYDSLPDDEKHRAERELADLQTAEGLQTTLFAAEPTLRNPTNIDVDARGRVWVCEGYNYRMKLNLNNPYDSLGDRIVILEDTDGDGKADKNKVFYQGPDINSALGIAVLGNQVIVSCSPNVYVFTDADGDDVPEKKEILYQGIEGEQHDHGMHAFVFGPDGKLYFNFGNEGKKLLDKNGQLITDVNGYPIEAKGTPFRQGMVFRAELDGSRVEVLGHNFRNNYEVAVDSYGTLWQSDNDDDGNKGVRINYVMPYGNYGYTDEMTGAGWRTQRTNQEAEIPLRHWHQNDPGAVPNLLQTGAGSPTGILVYEGGLLPQAFRNQVIHCDAGPNVVRAYPATNQGAGYKATLLDLVKNTHDQWFRPADVCVAPDGSLFIADWYDPGVGGHQVGDVNRGRIFRVAPADAAKYQVPKTDLTTPEGAVAALQSPNMAIRYLAWTKLHEWQAQAEPALVKLWENENPRIKARALWLLTKIKGKEAQYVAAGLQSADPNLRITALRAAQQTGLDVVPYLQQLAKDADPQVRREVALALRFNKSAAAPAIWATLASQYDGQDRWYLEALGLGSDVRADEYFAAWKTQVGDNWNTPAGQGLVWRVRSKQTLPHLAELVMADKQLANLRYFRAFDFHPEPEKNEVLVKLLNAPVEQKDKVMMLALSHLQGEGVKRIPAVQAALQKALPSVKGTHEYLRMVERFNLADQKDELFKLALAQPDSAVSIDAAKLLVKMNQKALFAPLLYGKDKAAALKAIGLLRHQDNPAVKEMFVKIFNDPKADATVRTAAAKAYAQGWGGEEMAVKAIESGKLAPEVQTAMAESLMGAWRAELRKVAMGVLKIQAPDGQELPPIYELVKLNGDAAKGKAQFTKYCQTCHQVGAEGINFGPALSEIGSKLGKEGLYNAILNPNAGISFGYEGWQLLLKDGSVAAGILASETSDGLEIRLMGGRTNKYAKSEVSEKTQMPTSLMPRFALPKQDLADLVEYLTTLKKADLASK